VASALRVGEIRRCVGTSSERLDSNSLQGAGFALRWAAALRSPCLPTLAVGALAVLPLAGCGREAPVLNVEIVERAVARSILIQHHLHAGVKCPEHVPRQAGLVFTCTARLEVGTYPVSATVTSTNGHIRYQNRAPLTVLDITRVEQAIRDSILIQRHERSTVRCPAEVIQQAAIAFSCTANVHHRSYPFEVREVDSKGHVRYLGRRSSP
jgi:hypothetical protein